jgi:hypothetical protein
MDGLVRDAVVERGVLAERFAIDTATADSMPLPTRLCMTSGKTGDRRRGFSRSKGGDA